MRMNEYEMKDLIPIVAELTESFTSKESTSISYTAAKQLMDAVLYCINEYSTRSETDLKSPNISSVLAKSEHPTAKEAYQSGYQLVVQKVLQTKQIYDEIILEFNGYRNRAYIDTVVKGMPSFFLYYDARYQPQNHILTLDYPTILPVEPLCGIDAIHQYINDIKVEQYFLNKLPQIYVLEVLERYHEDYEELLINICTIIVRNIIGHMIAGSSMEQEFKESDYQKIRSFVLGCSRVELEDNLMGYINTLVKHAYEDSQYLKEYLNGDVKDFAITLIRGVEHNYLNKIFVK
jgi:DNA-binding ferritin-like protein (Dps family)